MASAQIAMGDGEAARAVDRRAPDKQLHELAGVSLALLGAAIGGAVGLPLPVRTLVSFSFAAAAGLGKEWVDSRGYGDVEVLDFVHTLLGGVIGVAVVLYGNAVVFDTAPAGLEATSHYGQVGLMLAVPVAVELASHLTRLRSRGSRDTSRPRSGAAR